MIPGCLLLDLLFRSIINNPLSGFQPLASGGLGVGCLKILHSGVAPLVFHRVFIGFS